MLLKIIFISTWSSVILSPHCLCRGFQEAGEADCWFTSSQVTSMFSGVHFEACVLFFLYYIWQLSSPKSVFLASCIYGGPVEDLRLRQNSSAVLCLRVQQMEAVNESSGNFWAAQFSENRSSCQMNISSYPSYTLPLWHFLVWKTIPGPLHEPQLSALFKEQF